MSATLVWYTSHDYITKKVNKQVAGKVRNFEVRLELRIKRIAKRVVKQERIPAACCHGYRLN